MKGAVSPSLGRPYYFGAAQELFGVYHAADGGRRRADAVVLCYPGGHEYLRVHRAFRNLAVSLARLGFPVLRFDYAGTGDSAGDGADVTLARWRADVLCAMDEVKRLSGARTVSVAAMRLGASLACLAAEERADLDVLVLWEPILRGRAYLSQLREVERSWLADPSRRQPQAPEIASRRLLGFPLGERMEQEIAALDLAAGPPPRAARAFALLEAEPAEEAGWRERFRAVYGATACGVLPSGANWLHPEAIHVALYPQAAQRTIVTVFDKLAA